MSVETVLTIGGVGFCAGDIDMQGYSRSTSWRHVFTDVAAGGSAQHFDGEGEDTFDLDGIVFPGQYGSADAADQLRELAAEGQPHTMIRGDGTDMGEYYVLAVTEENRRITRTGQGRVMTYSMRLRKDTHGTG